MLQFFRSMLKSKIGAGVAVALLVLIALAFASSDVANNGGFGGIGGGTSVATVGGEKIDNAMLSESASAALERFKQDQPTMSMKAFVSAGGLEKVLEDLIDRTAMAVFGKDNGVVAGDRLIDSEIAGMQAFQGPDGKFNEVTFRQAIQQRGVSEALLRNDLRQGLIARQLLVPASFGAIMPRDLATRYAALLTERREGSVVVLPSLLFAPQKEPSDAELRAFYKAHASEFIRPERRVIRYAQFGDDVVRNVPAPSDAEIAARYKASKAQYAAQEKRRITQLIVPTEPAAKAVIAEVAKGKTLEVVAREKGLSAAPLDFFTKEQLSSQFSPAIANAVFAAPAGKLTAPARSPLGWHIIRVEQIDDRPARTLDQVKPEIATIIAAEKRRAALTSMLENVESEFDQGSSLVDVAGKLGLKVETTPPLLADGNVYLKPGETMPPQLRPVLATAFAMEQEDPQVAEVERGKTFVIYDVPEIAASAPAPYDQIKPDVKLSYAITKGYEAARAAAIKVQQALRKGVPLEQAMAGSGRQLPPVQQIAMSRPDLSRAQQAGKEIPPPVKLIFGMAKGTIKVQAAPQKRGWFVVSLREIVPGKVEGNNPLIPSAQRELGQVAGNEYAAALRKAIVKEVGSTRHETGIRAVRDQLTGAGSAGN
ncbi:peptidylprolyl isomerase [Novosphingobium album (ex Liu et al. 2023)]|uniref:Parvulin-like PPIase n=1 Tax=Novosphingobium album (ex Liu et al. 2023) TaxID=3031130 RepID=A0ABT5WWB2_9SPHN|nr:peptidylprolyl isomerase [Novosphingobium album (ex Liu et al. 2023)]MDE8654196.1 SurA N-terminal domain-containing protein [Novosphingobium album (ex Liu et al. 2023)]